LFEPLFGTVCAVANPKEALQKARGVAPQTRPDRRKQRRWAFSIVAAGAAGDVLLCADSKVNCQSACVFYEAFACCCLKIALFVLAIQGQGS
jgi:hypothetical protein